MPAAIAVLLRQLIIVVVQTGLFVGIQAAITAVLDKVRKHSVEEIGLEGEDADNYVANTFIDVAIMAGVTIASLRTRLPLKIADKLGFTTKGFSKRPLSPAGAAKVKSKGGDIIKTSASKTQTADEIAETVSKSRGITFSKVSQAANILVAGIGVPVGVGLLITNIIDFGAWNSSAYQNSFQSILSKFGLNPDTNASSPKSISKEMFDKLYAAMQASGVTAFKDPYNEVVYPLTRENLVNTADKVAGQINWSEGKTTFKDLIAVFTAVAIYGDKKPPAVSSGSGGSSTGSGSSGGAKVFMGIVSQGALGQSVTFIERPDDMIENATELQDAAQNNLSSFILSLPGKIVYEVKIVSSVITKDGFKQVGATQRIVSSYDTYGNPRYKTLTNKFATLTIYVLTDKGARAKIATIILGPVDAVKFNPNQNTLRLLENQIQSSIFTKSISDIKSVETKEPITITTPKDATNNTPVIKQPSQNQNQTTQQQVTLPSQNTAAAKPKYDLSAAVVVTNQEQLEQYKKLGWDIRSNPNSNSSALAVPPLTVTPDNFAKSIGVPNERINQQTGEIINPTTAEIAAFNSMFYTVTPTSSGTKPGVNASNLSEWYQANGQSLPSISQRSNIYQSLGLGQASFYTGTAEQNTKLLNALKAQ